MCRDQDSQVYSLQLPFKPEPEKVAAQQAAAGAGALPAGIPPPPGFGSGPPPLPPQVPAPPPQFNPVSALTLPDLKIVHCCPRPQALDVYEGLSLVTAVPTANMNRTCNCLLPQHTEARSVVAATED